MYMFVIVYILSFLTKKQMLTVPLSDNDKSLCAYFVKDISRQSEVVNYSKIW